MCATKRLDVRIW